MRKFASPKYIAILMTIVVAWSSICIAYAEKEEKTYKDILSSDKVIDINIDIANEDYQDMLAYPLFEEYHSANVTIDGITVNNVGIRTKGNMTLKSVANSDSDRYSLRLKFNKYVSGQKFLGLDDLCLNNQYSDASYMREYLHYQVLEEMGVNVPEVAFCNVYINGDLAGFYLAVQPYENTYLEDKFGKNFKKGNLYKMDMGSTLEYKEDENYSYADLKVGKDENLDAFKKFVKNLNGVETGQKGDLESFLDIDSALIYIASNTVLTNYDSYNGNMHHNFYLYQDESGIFHVLPWDFNMSFGGFQGGTEVGIDTPIVSGNMETLPLINKLLSVPEYKERYYDYIKEMMGILADFSDTVSDLKEVIAPYVKNDPTSFVTYDEFEKATTYNENEESDYDSFETPNFGGERPGNVGGKQDVGKQDVGKENTEISNQPKIDGDRQGKSGENQDAGNRNIEIGNKPKSDDVATKNAGGRQGIESEKDSGFEFNEQTPNNNEAPQMQGGRIMGTSNRSIINCVKNRLKNLEEQFAGTADKETPVQDERSGHGTNGMRPDDWQTLENAPGEGMEWIFSASQNGDFPQRPDAQGKELGGKFGGMGGRNKPEKIRVNLNGHIIMFNQDPIVENGTTLVPYRTIAEALGAEVEWGEAFQTVTVKKDEDVIILRIGQTTATVNGEKKALLTAPQIINDETLVPIRFISECFGLSVSWEDNSQLITIIKKNK